MCDSAIDQDMADDKLINDVIMETEEPPSDNENLDNDMDDKLIIDEETDDDVTDVIIIDDDIVVCYNDNDDDVVFLYEVITID